MLDKFVRSDAQRFLQNAVLRQEGASPHNTPAVCLMFLKYFLGYRLEDMIQMICKQDHAT